MRKRMHLAVFIALVSLILAACGADTGASATTEASGASNGEIDPETYYEGKTIRFVTSSGPGGGTDLKIRTLASQLTRFIPGNPATQVTNIEPHVAGMNFLWNAEPDGLTIGLTAAPTLEFEFFDEAEWDSSEWTYIGAMDAACDNVLLVRGDLGYETVDDLAGADGPTLVTMEAAPTPADVEPVGLGTMLIADYLDWPLEVKRVAESGQGALNLAMERGEINFARYGASWCLLPEQNPEWLEGGFVIPILDVAARSTDAQMAEGVEEPPPHVSEILTEEQYEEWRGLVAASREGGNPIFMPPGTPEEIADIIRNAWEEAIQDEDFVEAMVGAFGGSELSLLTGEEIATIATDNLAVMTEHSDRYDEIVAELYEKYVR